MNRVLWKLSALLLTGCLTGAQAAENLEMSATTGAVAGPEAATAEAATLDASPARPGPRIYVVANVAPDDGLNMRSTPGVQGDIVLVLPSNAHGVLGLGEEQSLGRSTWIKVSWGGKQGWVNKYYLRENVHTSNYNPADSRPVNRDVVMQCGGTEPFWSMQISERAMQVNVLGGPQYNAPVEFRQQSVNNTSIAVVAGNRGNANTTAFLQKVETCSDGMSDRNYPYAITAVLNSERVMSGCCSLNGLDAPTE